MCDKQKQFDSLINTFEALCHLPTRHKVNVLSHINEKIIQAISVSISSILLGNRLSHKQKRNLKKKLYPIHKDLRVIADENITIKKKRKLIIKHATFLNYILETVIPLLTFPSATGVEDSDTEESSQEEVEKEEEQEQEQEEDQNDNSNSSNSEEIEESTEEE